MEIRTYLKFLRQRWWVVLTTFALTLAATIFLTLRTPPVYVATVSYIVSLSSLSTDERFTISALDTLTNRTEIGATYAKVANSRSVQEQAAKQLGLSSRQGLSVSSQVIAGTNILEISVEGSDPALVRDYTNAIGDQTVTYVQSLYETYKLELLDAAVLPRIPAEPNTQRNLLLGGILGIVLGFGLAALVEYLQTPPEPGMLFNILDERTGLYNLQYFMLRLQQEMSRAKRKGGTVALALLNIDHDGLINRSSNNLRAKAMRRVANILGANLRDEDVLAAFDESNLALLLPDASEPAARTKVEKLLEKIHLSPLELDGTGNLFNLHMAAGLTVYRKEKTGEEASPEELMIQAERALIDTKFASYGKVLAFGEVRGDNHFHHTKEIIATEPAIRAPQMVMSNVEEGE